MAQVLAFLDCLPLAALLEQRTRPWLRGRPVAVAGGPADRVVSVSPEAERCGAYRRSTVCAADATLVPGTSHARRNLVTVRETPSLREWGTAAARDVVGRLSLHVAERPSGFLLAPVRAWTPPVWARTLEDDLSQALGFGLPLGLGSMAFICRLAAARCAPGHFCWVEPGCEPGFLSPLRLEALPTLAGVHGALLRQMGLATVGDVSRLPLHLLVAGLGDAGRYTYMEARGLDPAADQPTSSGVWMSRRFSPATNSLLVMERELTDLVEQALARMDRRDERPTSLRLLLFTSDCRREEATYRVHPRATAEGDILCAARRLLSRLGRRRVAVTEILVGFEQPTRVEQTELLWGAELREFRVGKAIRAVRNRFGENSLLKASRLRAWEAARRRGSHT
jgi:nucleotidyltransferase/DNA polymerase involved in DNA repair